MFTVSPGSRTRRPGSRMHSRQDERGSVSAELVIATPLLLLLIMAVIQFALWQHATHIAQAAAQQGVAEARLQGQTAAAGQGQADTVLAQVAGGLLLSPTVRVTRTATATTVIVTGRAEGVLDIFSLPVRAVAAGPTETLTTPGQAP